MSAVALPAATLLQTEMTVVGLPSSCRIPDQQVKNWVAYFCVLYSWYCILWCSTVAVSLLLYVYCYLNSKTEWWRRHSSSKGRYFCSPTIWGGYKVTNIWRSSTGENSARWTYVASRATSFSSHWYGISRWREWVRTSGNRFYVLHSFLR